MSTNIGNNLSEFLSFETKHQSSSSDDTTIGRHALDQLLESKLGNEITWCAQQLATNNKHNNDSSDEINSSVLEEEVTKLMGTPAFQQINAQIRECPLSLLLPSNQTTSVNNRSDDDITIIGSSNKKSREESTAAANNNKPAATSFSLFDLMDSQKGAFVLPPRIMAQQVIDADQRHDNNIMTTNNSNDDAVQNYSSSSGNTADSAQQATNSNNDNKSALELLEQAEDMEDLSPDIDSWEQILSILYRGLSNKTNVVERRRYFNVHMLMFDKCQKTNGGGGGMFRSQTWGLTFNIVGFILSLSNEFDKKEDEQNMMTDLDLYWDSCHHFVLSLSHLAMEYVTSSVGHEKEMERMSLGLCSILCTDVSSCVLAMMEPMAGWFEVWARFVGPSTLMSILRVSGLGEVVLRRCESRGRRNEASKRLHEMIRQRDGSSSVTPTLEDLEESNFLQSLSILRVITSRCDATLGSMGSIFCCNATLSSFLSADGIVSSDEVQAMLGTKEQCLSIAEQEEMRSRLLKPFRDVLLLRESTPALVDADLEELCTQVVSLIEQLC
ncbi:hypothetical protein QTG54_009658 [Skeletonema marinoi]|uniref:Uncharacterized protein n=1 Tax=Skeletonema marinoi TaxID=267567 RepID=A0AAD8Y556_9STRA|nr:hypothetical protein QTG54_009658 [Skeletonema marinoi]